MKKEGERIIWVEPGKVIMEKYEIPSPGENQVLIETEVTLISPGTERAHFLKLENTPQSFPRAPEGYNNIGKIITAGKNVEAYYPGERVASNGNHATHIVLDAKNIFKVPERLTSDEAVFFTMGSIALQGIRKADIELGESIAVLGQGLIGQFATQLARMSGAFPTISIDIVESRLLLSKQLAADFTINAREQSVSEKIREYTNQPGVDVLIECTGGVQPIVDSFSLVDNRGRIILLGSPREKVDGVNFYPDIHSRGISIIGAHNFVRPSCESSKNFWTYKDDNEFILNLLAMERLKVKEFIDKKLSYKKAKEAYELLLKGSKEILGILLSWV